MAILQTGPVDLYYELSGKGPPVILIQGVGVLGEGWRREVAELDKNFQTLIFDNRGIGQSARRAAEITIEAMAEDVLALMDSLQWDSAHLVGHSMGGVIAQQFALTAPTRVRSLSLLCTFARGKDAARPTPWVIWMSLRTRLGTRRMKRRAFLEMLLPKHSLRNADVQALAAEFGALIGRDLATQPPILMKQLKALARHDTSTRLHELKRIPTLVVSAQEDKIALPKYGRQLAEKIPGARFELLEAASHGVIIDQASRVNQFLVQFLSDAERRRSN